LAATGEGAAELVMEAEQIALSVAGKIVFGREDETLEQAVVKQLASAQKTIALAESCTGGYIGHRITNVSGASAVFLASYVTYSNEAKQRMLGVKADTVDDHGAVSEAVVREMAEGARTQSGADYAIAVTGIAGPTGGTDDKPVGTVFIALASKHETKVLYRINSFDRETFKFVTAQQALDLLRITMLD
jgi:nicotinamide-nucleotide amidase